MLKLPHALLRDFTVFDVSDPDELGDDSRVSTRFPGYNNFNTYRLHDRGVRNTRDAGLLTRLAVRRTGALTTGFIQSRFSNDVGIIGAGVPRLILTFPLLGATALLAGPNGGGATASGTRGLVYRGRAGTALITSDDNTRITLQVDEARLARAWGALRGEGAALPEFATGVDWSAPALAPVLRLVQHLVSELAEADGLFSVPAAVELMTDALIQLLLARLPQVGPTRGAAERQPAVPRQLRRAEAFIEAHVGEAFSLDDVAAAAGCSTRSLQLAFRRYRDTTPLAAIQEARLLAARTALLRTDWPVAEVARRYGFSRSDRFERAFLRRFGTLPGDTR